MVSCNAFEGAVFNCTEGKILRFGKKIARTSLRFVSCKFYLFEKTDDLLKKWRSKIGCKIFTSGCCRSSTVCKRQDCFVNINDM